MNASDFSTYINDFCDSFADTLPQRTKFVEALKDIVDQTAFTAQCFAAQSEDGGIVKNAWFDPIDPQASITQQEICDLHFQLFK